MPTFARRSEPPRTNFIGEACLPNLLPHKTEAGRLRPKTKAAIRQTSRILFEMSLDFRRNSSC
jgi:hypothetical protein